jgi:putative flavoprotein involved in K+ transport
MQTTTVVIVGAGQAGLAMSRCLTELSVDHVLLERGEVANSWRTERWDSLRLLTPNWLSRLPAWHYRGDDPDGYMTAAQVAAHLDAYRADFGAPVLTGTTVGALRPSSGGYTLATGAGPWRCRSVVVATGAASTPRIPALHADLPRHLVQLSSLDYRNPGLLPDGAVLVVGASASGVQIADELRRSGRRVLLAVGDHVRVPRSYRGMDIHWWMDALGIHDERSGEVDDLGRARRLPSLQLIGTPERRTLDLNALAAAGVELLGRLSGTQCHHGLFAGSLPNFAAAADLKLRRLLDRIDAYVVEHGLDAELEEGPSRPEPTRVGVPPTRVDLRSISTVIWATGFRPRYPWLPQQLLGRRGEIRHEGGVMAQPGLYVLGLPFLRRRKSSFLDGVGDDAAELSRRLRCHLDAPAARV